MMGNRREDRRGTDRKALPYYMSEDGYKRCEAEESKKGKDEWEAEHGGLSPAVVCSL